ncbi:MAG: GspE/PulE family protein [Deltaproteobacteria bacterium]
MYNNLRKRFGEFLFSKNLITDEKIEEALSYQSEHKEFKIGEIICKLGFIEQEQVLIQLSQFLDKKHIILDGMIMSSELSDIFSLDFMTKHNFVPFDLNEGILKIAIDDINNFELKTSIDSIASKNNFSTEYFISFINQIKKYLDSNYIEKVSFGKDIPQLVDFIIEEGIKKNSSDIHIEPVTKNRIRIRYRIDGQMILSKIGIPKEEYEEVVSRIKILANLNTTEKRRPQDGNISDFKVKDGSLFDIRVSIVSIAHGEKVVLRLLNKNEQIKDLLELGFNDYQVFTIKNNIRHKNGIIFVTGATGMGKSTTLYTTLHILNRIFSNVVTLENPVERTIEGLNQISINDTIGITFSSTLRTVLRQDPDVIMVGEIRDKETLSIALEASMTGHLVLTTLHTNSAVQTIDRVNSMGIDMYNFTASLLLVISQKLIKKLCTACRIEYSPNSEELEYMQSIIKKPMDKNIKLYKSCGCNKCNNGYLGREVVCELFENDEKIEKLLINKASSAEVQAYLNSIGFNSIKHHALQKVLSGITSLDEVKSIFAE